MGRFRLLHLGPIALCSQRVNSRCQTPLRRLHVPMAPRRIQIVWQAEGAHRPWLDRLGR